MPRSSVSVVPIGKKICRPFLLQVMVFSPEAGYRFEVLVEKGCTPEADAVWKVVFDLYKVAGGQDVQIVHVSFTAGSPVEQVAVERMAAGGVNQAQADAFVNDVHPAAKAVAGQKKVAPARKKALHDAMAKAVTAVDV